MTPRVLACLLLATAAAACGDDQPSSDDPQVPEADGGPAPDGGAGTARVFAVATDYATTGVAATIDLPGMTVTSPAIAGVASTDPVVKKLDQVYVINRFGADNVTIVDGESLTLIDQVSTGGGSNPQDVVATDDRLFVSGLGTAGVLVFDRADLQAGPIATIDLSALDDADGLPDCTSLAIAGDRLFVACAIYADFVPADPGVVAIVALDTLAIEATIPLPHANPFGPFTPTADGLLLATMPRFDDLRVGCVARIDVDATAASPPADCLLDNAELGGYAAGIAAGEDGIWFAVVSGFDPVDYGAFGALRRYDRAGAALGPALTPAEQRVFDVVACPSGHVVVADAAGGVRVYDAAGGELTTGPLNLGLPPVSGGLACY